MKKALVISLVIISLMGLGTTLISNASAQPENAKILSYSWYTASTTNTLAYSLGDLVVVGEVQNNGPNTLDYVTVKGTAYTKDGQAQAVAYNAAFVHPMLPGQKAPFYLDFNYQTSVSENTSWVSLGIDHVNLQVTRASVNNTYLNTNLAVIANTSYTDTNGFFTVAGVVQNNGSETPSKVWVVTTYYNDSGTVVGEGYTEILTPLVSANNTITFQFTANPFDSTAQMSSQIKSYSILVQSEDVAIPEFPSTALLAILLVAVTVAAAIFSRQRMSKRMR